MFASDIFESAEELRGFLDNIESLMRRGQPDVAASILDAELNELADAGHDLAKLCTKTPVSAVRIVGWEEIESHLNRLDKPNRPMTAISFDIIAPLHYPEEGDDLFIEPEVETIFYSDAVFPFSTADRNRYIEAYGAQGGEWQGSFVDIGNCVRVRGLGAVYGEVLALERNIRAEKPCRPADHDLLAMASAFVAVRVHQAIRAVIEGRGMVRALAVLVGSNEAFPDFDAPAITRDEYEDLLDGHYEEEGADYSDQFASLVLAPPADDYDPFAAVVDDGQISGATLRKRLRETVAAELPANDEEPPPQNPVGIFFSRFLKRSA